MADPAAGEFASLFLKYWVYFAILYGIAMRILRARWWHALWMAALVSIAPTVSGADGVEDVIKEAVGIEPIPIGALLMAAVVSQYLFKLTAERFFFKRLRSRKTRHFFDYLYTETPAPFFSPIFFFGHMWVVTFLFLPLFVLVTGLCALIGRRRAARAGAPARRG